jgi:alpha-L-fucosidase
MNYGESDFRFTQGRDGSVYAWCLTVPAPGTELKIQSLGLDAKLAAGPVKSVALLGSSEKIEWHQDAGALVIRCPASMPFQHAIGFRVGQ